MSRFTPRPSLVGVLVTGLLTGLVPALLAGCGQAEPRAVERVAAADAPIINGTLDTTHPAVVAVLAADFECSGTILQVKNGKGYVLTAGHCCPPGDLPTQVVMGQDYNTGQAFNIVAGSVVADACYQSCAGSTDDVCMLKFSGATASTPVIPPMTPATDNLQVGTSITYVGYGIVASPPGGNNSKRRTVSKTIGTLDSYFVEYANPGTSGTCEGDSGGPGLVLVNGVEQVASVTSYGDQACTMLGASIRTSVVYTSFIEPYLQDATPNPACPADADCQVCLNSAENPQCNGDCATATSDCFNDAACSALVQCYQGCSASACITDCNNGNLDGLQKYEGITACLCTGSCAAACHNQFCVSPKCGTKPKSSPAACTTCVEDTCCAEAWACSQDAACKKCFSATSPAASCASNAPAIAYYQCTQQNCGSTGCSLKDPAGTAGTTSSSVASSSSAAASGGGGTGGAAGTGGAIDAATGSGGSTVGQKSGCAVGSPVEGELPAAPIGALVIGAAAALQRRRRRG
jgi:hypothetical protein